VFLDRVTRCIDEGGSMDVIFLDLAKVILTRYGTPQKTDREVKKAWYRRKVKAGN